MNKRAANLSVDAALLDEAKALGLNLSATFETVLCDAVRAAKAAQWQADNRAALQSSSLFRTLCVRPIRIRPQQQPDRYSC